MQPKAFSRLLSLSAAPQEQTHAPFFMAIISQNVDVFNEAAKLKTFWPLTRVEKKKAPRHLAPVKPSNPPNNIHTHMYWEKKKEKKRKCQMPNAPWKKIKKINRASFSSELLESPPAALQLNFSPLRLAQSHRFRFALWRRKHEQTRTQPKTT